MSARTWSDLLRRLEDFLSGSTSGGALAPSVVKHARSRFG